MKKNKIAVAVIMAVTLIVLITCVILLSKDRKGPVITIPSDLAYVDGMSHESLLAGVSAYDDKDKDVSDSLIVKSVIVLSDGQTVKITFAASDSQNNITEKSVTLNYEQPKEPESKDDTKDDVKDEPVETPSESDTPANTESTDSEPVTQYPEETTPVETVTPEAPVLYLTKIEDTLKVGSDVKWLQYVSDITDDKDDRNTLFKAIRIDDYPDMNVPGDYDMKFYCRDTDGNFSPKITLHIHVVG